jgi:hypothetical protein
MKHLILPIASSPYEGAHQSSIIIDLEKPDDGGTVFRRQSTIVDGVPVNIAGWVYFDATTDPATVVRVITP